jgi:hypothetical protein
VSTIQKHDTRTRGHVESSTTMVGELWWVPGPAMSVLPSLSMPLFPRFGIPDAHAAAIDVHTSLRSNQPRW